MNPDFWSHQPKTIARLLLGKSIIFGSTQATILKAQAFSREENSQDGLYRPLLEMSPGEVYCARRRNAVLLLFVTLDNGRVGGCVLIRTVEVNRSIYDGPGKTSAELGLNDHGRKGRTEWVDEDTLLIQLDQQTPQPIPRERRRPSVGNGIGQQALQRLMPKIVAAYLKAQPTYCSFQEFLNQLLGKCRTIGEMRGELR